MAEKNKNRKNQGNVIRKIGITDDSLTSRGGLTFVLKYFQNINIIPLITNVFQGIRKSRKGKDLEKIVTQLMMYFIDGCIYTMTRFDELAKDIGYRMAIESCESDMCSSHVIKRFFNATNKLMFSQLQKILLDLFIWRLSIEKPQIIILGLDTMVLNNDDAKKRKGVTYTYKKVFGYHPLHIYWNGYIVNLAFHEGSEAPNHKNDLFILLEETVNRIRQRFNKDIPILTVSDSGFFDQKYFQKMEEFGVFFICGGRIIDAIKLDLMKHLPEEWRKFEKKGDVIEYLDFHDQRNCWKKGYRAIYTKHACKDGEFRLAFDRPENIIYTNLEGTELLREKGLDKYASSEEIVRLYHLRAKDELVNRGIKEFVDETLPFKSFESNGVYYFLSIISFNLFTAFQRDVLKPIIPSVSYPDTVRRLFIDIAGKIVRKGRETILKFRQEVVDRLNLFDLWKKCGTVIPI
jgi:hypothetical protein